MTTSLDNFAQTAASPAQDPACVLDQPSTEGFKDKKITFFILFLIAFAWGFNYVIVKNVYTAITPFSYCASRFIAAGILLMLLAYFKSGENPLITDKKDMGMLALISFGGFGASNLLMAVALKYTLASTTSIILSTSPLITLIIAPLFKIDKFCFKKFMAILLSLFGIYCIFIDRQSLAAAGSNYYYGILLAFFSTLAWSIYSIFSKPLLKKYSPLRLTANAVFISSLMMIPFAYGELAQTRWLSLPAFVYASFIFSIFFSTILPMIFWNICIKKTGPVTTMTFSNLTPAFAMLCGYILLQEPVSANQITGSLIVIVSIIIAYI
ncbi:MAG: putative DMT superfamily transporter inner membrane protein [bacterium ADurb.Bin243]|nr:MAG: putative DMT superfamily transporter inner membrane protein [bacterium ADurb.Bin243]